MQANCRLKEVLLKINLEGQQKRKKGMECKKRSKKKKKKQGGGM